MYSEVDLPDSLPIFPLPGALLLPRARLPLHVFEPRYLAMLDDVLKTSHRLIGMVQPLEGHKEGAPKLHSIGCAGRLTSFSETDDGRYMISLTGVSRFRVETVQDGFLPYLKADAGWGSFSRDLGNAEHDPSFERKSFLKMLNRFFESEGLSTDWSSLEEAEDELLINSLAMLCPFEPEDKQALLESPSLSDRRATLTTLIEFALYGGTNDEAKQ